MNKVNKLYTRVSRYYKKWGFASTIKNTIRNVYRELFQRQYYIYSVNLIDLVDRAIDTRNFTIACRKSKEEFSALEVEEFSISRDYRIWNDECEDRFEKGATIWLATIDGHIAGFVWSVEKNTIEPYFIPLQGKDIHLFDNEIFEKYRGTNLNPIFINNILCILKDQGFERAYMETKIWNDKEIRSLQKTSFNRIAVASKYKLLHHVIVIWNGNAE